MRSLRWVLWVVIVCFRAAPCEAFVVQTKEIAGLEVAFWLPDQIDSTQGKWPVILFSHGLGGCNTQASFLMEALADAGYAVFAPNHDDSSCSQHVQWLHHVKQWLGGQPWSDPTYANRGEDMRVLLDALETIPRFSRLDWQRVALAGHSMGGYTALAVAGAWPEWKDGRIKAVLALAPYTLPFVSQPALKNVAVPVMYQAGSDDPDITSLISQEGGAYDQTAGPKIYVELDGAPHYAWTNTIAAWHNSIKIYSIAFFDCYLKGKPIPRQLMKAHADVSIVREGNRKTGE